MANQFMTTDEKKIELEKIAQEIRNFKDLEIAKYGADAVSGEGSPDAERIIIGGARG